MIKKLFLLPLLLLVPFMAMKAQTKTIHVTPDNAKIYVDGQEVGTGHYSVKFNRKTDFYVLKFVCPGYISRTNIKLLKTDPRKTVSYTLEEDEFFKNSVGPGSKGGEDVDLANKWFDVVCKKGLTEDQVWKRLMAITTKGFQNVEIRDKSAGWIRTAWTKTIFSNQIARTRLEIKINTDDSEEMTYRVKIHSEINNDAECIGDDCFEKSDRVLKKYVEVVNELQNKLE